MTIYLRGVSASKGVAIGRLVIVAPGQVSIPERRLRPEELEPEVERFRGALGRARARLDALRGELPPDLEAEVAAFLGVHLLMLEDAAFAEAPIAIMRERLCNAEWALKLQRDTLVRAFDVMDDPYLKTRRDDVEHVVRELQWELRASASGRALPGADGGGDEAGLDGRVVFAEDLAPADVIVMRNRGVEALLTEYGGATSHTAILARSLRIPTIVGVRHGRQYLRDNDLVVVDGRQGSVLVDPDPRILRHYEAQQRNALRLQSVRAGLREAPAVTRDGVPVRLQANVELARDMEGALQVGADGVGLFRTEGLFLGRGQPPDEEEQLEVYRSVVLAMNGAPVTIRTLDLGADRPLEGTRAPGAVAPNPALGLRAVRLCLREPDLFRPQLRAILRASAAGPVRLMVPMVSTLDEVLAVRALVAELQGELERAGVPCDRSMPVGIMVEVPAVALCAELFAREADFLSIGTNDLIQYAVAIDRVDDDVSYLYDPLHPGVLRLIQTTIRAGDRLGVPVAMCGEMAGDPRYTRLLLGMGLREFSVHPNVLLEVKQVIRDTDTREVRAKVGRLMRTVRSGLREALLREVVGFG